MPKKIGLAYQDCVVLEEKGNIKFITQKKKVKESPNPKVKILFIVGLFSNVDDELENYLKVTKQELKEIEKKINLLNEKYGIYCRVPENKTYFYINDLGKIIETIDKRKEEDNIRNKIGNYFISENRAKLFLEQLRKYTEENVQGNFNIFYKNECFTNVIF